MIKLKVSLRNANSFLKGESFAYENWAIITDSVDVPSLVGQKRD